MAVHSLKRKILYESDGTTLDYPFDFKLLNPYEAAVVVADGNGGETNLIYGDEYGVVLNEDGDENPGGVVTLVEPVAAGRNIAIYSAMDYLQPTVFTNQGGFYPTVLNDSLDRTTIQIQQLLEWAGRTVVMPMTAADEFSSVMPPPQPGFYLAWSADGRRLINKAGTQDDREFWYTADSPVIDIANGTKQKFTARGDVSLSLILRNGDDVTLLLNPRSFQVRLPDNIVWFDRAIGLTPDTWHSLVISNDNGTYYGWWQVQA